MLHPTQQGDETVLKLPSACPSARPRDLPMRPRNIPNHTYVSLARGTGAKHFFVVFGAVSSCGTSKPKHHQNRHDKTWPDLLIEQIPWKALQKQGTANSPSPNLKHSYRTTEGNAQDGQGLPVCFQARLLSCKGAPGLLRSRRLTLENELWTVF